ncbi:MAG: alpha-amylase, partial [candidate division Zixibacteria bacterium]|nr:alpha-amylase [candidate division Zixibacteria bacterium]
MTIKNVLEFSPEVLKRFVNFMNNPDERTAVDQFGRGDKYYGVAVMMVTMPGLPMFGHGQVEGLAEKYGMEYRRSYWDEQVDQGMVHRHENEIFPLMRRRRLFSGATNYALYDFSTPDGWVDENVFAYSNRAGGECAIIMYNNAYNTTRGTIHTSTAINVGDGTQTVLVRRTLTEALGLDTSDNSFYAFRDYQSGLEYLRSGRQLAEQGLFAELHAYQYHAFLDFRNIHDSDGSWRELERRLNGAGVVSIDEAYRELRVEPVLGPYRALMNPVVLREVLTDGQEAQEQVRAGMSNFCESVRRVTGASTLVEPLVQRFTTRWGILKSSQPVSGTKAKARKPKGEEAAWERLVTSELNHVGFAWLTLEALGELRSDQESTPPRVLALARVDQWMLLKAIKEAFEGWLSDSDTAYWDARLVPILLSHSGLLAPGKSRTLGESFKQALDSIAVREYLQVNTYNNILWLNKDRLERMMAALSLVAPLTVETGRSSKKKSLPDGRAGARKILAAAEKAGYQVEKMLQLLK